MKKAKIVILVLLIVAVLAGAGWVIYLAYELPPEEATAIVETVRSYCVERVVPIAVAVLAGVATILGLLAPVVRRVKEAAGRFGEAVSSVQGTESASRQATEAMEAWKAEMLAEQSRVLAALDARYTAAMAATEASTRAALDEMQAAVARCVTRMDADHAAVERTGLEARCMLDMMEAGLCNLPDVVASGAGVTIHRLAERARVEAAAVKETAGEAVCPDTSEAEVGRGGVRRAHGGEVSV